MSFNEYANHVAHKCRVAIAISVIKTKPPGISMEVYLDKLRQGYKETNVDEEDFDFSLTSEDFKIDTSLENCDKNNDNNKTIAKCNNTIDQSTFINPYVLDDCIENNQYDINYKQTQSSICTEHLNNNVYNILDHSKNTNYVNNQNVLENATNDDVFNEMNMSSIVRKDIKGVNKNLVNIAKNTECTIEASQSILKEYMEIGTVDTQKVKLTVNKGVNENVGNFNISINADNNYLNATSNIKSIIEKDPSILEKCVEKTAVISKNRDILDLNNNTNINVLSITNDMQSIIDVATITQKSINDANNNLFNDTHKSNQTDVSDVNNNRSFITMLESPRHNDTTKKLLDDAQKLEQKCDNSHGIDKHEIIDLTEDDDLDETFCSDTTINEQTQIYTVPNNMQEYCETANITGEKLKPDRNILRNVRIVKQYKVSGNCPKDVTQENILEKKPSQDASNYDNSLTCSMNTMFENSQVINQKDSCNDQDSLTQCSTDVIEDSQTDLSVRKNNRKALNKQTILTYYYSKIDKDNKTTIPNVVPNKKIKVLKNIPIKKGNININIRKVVNTKTDVIKITSNFVNEPNNNKIGINNDCLKKIAKPKYGEQRANKNIIQDMGNRNFSGNDTFQFVHTQEKPGLKENVINEIHTQHFSTNKLNYAEITNLAKAPVHQNMQKTNFGSMDFDKDFVYMSMSGNFENMQVDENFDNASTHADLEDLVGENLENIPIHSDLEDPFGENLENISTNANLEQPVGGNLETIPTQADIEYPISENLENTPTYANFVGQVGENSENVPTYANLENPVGENSENLPTMLADANSIHMELANSSLDNDLEAEKSIPFKVIEELSRAKRYLNAKEQKITVLSLDSGYRSSDHQTGTDANEVQLEQCGLTLYKALLEFHFTENNCSITEEISRVLGNLIDHLHTEESYPEFVSQVLEKNNSLLEDIFDKDIVDTQSKEESSSLLLSLNYSTNILGSTVEKFNVYLEKFHISLTSGEDLMEIQNIQKLENQVYMFHILEIILNRCKSSKINPDNIKCSQNAVISKTGIVEMWRKKWDPNFRDTENLVCDSEGSCFLEDCRELLKKIIVDTIEGYSLVSFAALQCYNHLQD